MRFLTLKSFFYSLATKRDGEYNSLSYDSKKAGFNNSGGGPKSTRRREHRNTLKCRLSAKERDSNEKFPRNLSNHQLSDGYISVP